MANEDVQLRVTFSGVTHYTTEMYECVEEMLHTYGSYHQMEVMSPLYQWPKAILFCGGGVGVLQSGG